MKASDSGSSSEPQTAQQSIGSIIESKRSWWKAYILAWLPLGASYLIILTVFVNVEGMTLITTWIANILFPSIASIGVVLFTLEYVIARSVRTQISLHTIAAVVYSTLWALALFRLLQVFSGLVDGDWSPPVWPSAVVAWQLFQGLALYFIVASGTYAYWALTKLSELHRGDHGMPSTMRIYTKSANGLVPVSITELSAAQSFDGTTILYVGPTQLESRLSLLDLESKLPVDKFLRVHRTTLINLDQIQAVEPAGNGRQSVHMRNGMTFETSRAGASALKSRFAIV